MAINVLSDAKIRDAKPIVRASKDRTRPDDRPSAPDQTVRWRWLDFVGRAGRSQALAACLPLSGPG